MYFLHQQGIARLDVVNFIAHGIEKEIDKENDADEVDENIDQKTHNKESDLESYALNLNKIVLDGKIDPVIGRENEIERVAQILCRRRKK